jgi:hypothetical protein
VFGYYLIYLIVFYMSNKMSDIDKELTASAMRGASEYYAVAINSTKALHERIIDGSILRGQIASTEISNVSNLLSASLLLNDLSVVKYLNTGKIKVTIPPSHHFTSLFGVDRIMIRVSPETLHKHNIDSSNPNFAPCFLFSESEEIKKLMDDLVRFIEAGNVIFQPSRAILARQKPLPTIKSKWTLIGVHEFQPLDLWEPDSPNVTSKPTPLVLENTIPTDKILFEVVLPFVSGVPFSDLYSLIYDEHDLITTFRVSLKDAVHNANIKNFHANEFVRDVLNPKIEQIARKFKTLERVYNIKTGAATIGTIVLAYTAAVTGGPIKGLLAVASASGFGVLANTYADYIAKRDELKGDPFYLLWKCKKNTVNKQ